MFKVNVFKQFDYEPDYTWQFVDFDDNAVVASGVCLTRQSALTAANAEVELLRHK